MECLIEGLSEEYEVTLENGYGVRMLQEMKIFLLEESFVRFRENFCQKNFFKQEIKIWFWEFFSKH